jgi:hypothetical protein
LVAPKAPGFKREIPSKSVKIWYRFVEPLAPILIIVSEELFPAATLDPPPADAPQASDADQASDANRAAAGAPQSRENAGAGAELIRRNGLPLRAAIAKSTANSL